MNNDYEQLELDTRPGLLKAVTSVTNEAIRTAGEMAERGTHCRSYVHNRHEAYGIAAEQYAKIAGAVKAIGKDADKLLGTLSEPNRSAIEAASDIYNSTATAAVILVMAAAELKRTMEDLYTAENSEPEPTPMEMLANGDGFEEAENLDPEDAAGDDE